MDIDDESSVPPQSSVTGKARETWEKLDLQPDASNNFEFLTFTDLQQTVDPRTKKKVRSHVMHRVHRTTRIGERSKNKGVVVLDTSSLFNEPPAPHQGQALIATPGPSNMGAGRSNPFANYPIPMNVRTQHLFDHLRGDFCPMFRTMSKLGFFQTMTDPAGFRQILCTSASHMEVLREKPATEAETSEALLFSTEAIQSVNRRLVDPVENTSDGIVGAILAFCCHSIMFQNLNNAITHLDGLEEIIRRRGGIESFRTNPVLRMMLFWADTNIAFAEDVSPRFSAPVHLLPSVNQRASQFTIMKLTEACIQKDLANAMENLYKFNQLLIDEASTRDVWTDGVFAELNLMPVLHKLLSIQLELAGGDPVVIKQEASRLGAINYLAIIRDKFAVNLSALVPLRKLKESVNFLESAIVNRDLPLLLWLLVVGGTQSIRKGERHRDRQVHEWFVTKLAKWIVLVGCASWKQVMHHVKDVLWIEGLAKRECEALRGEVSIRVWS